MTAGPSIDMSGWLHEHLDQASPDLLRSMVRSFAQARMSAEADAVCGAGYGERSDERVNTRTQIKQEKRELTDTPDAEPTELAALYEAKGLSAATARTASTELTARGPCPPIWAPNCTSTPLTSPARSRPPALQRCRLRPGSTADAGHPAASGPPAGTCRRHLTRAGAEPFDHGPVDDLVPDRPPPQPPRAQPDQQGPQVSGHAHQAHLRTGRSEVQVRRPDHLGLARVHELAIQDVPGQQHLTRTAFRSAPFDPRCAEPHGLGSSTVYRHGIEEAPAAASPDHDPGDQRVGISAGHLGSHIGHPARPLACLGQDWASDQPGQRDDVRPDQAAGQHGLRPVRGTAGQPAT